MGRSSTSYQPKWNLGKTAVIRVPQKLVPALLRYARELDGTSAFSNLHDPAVAYCVAANFGTRKLRCDLRATFATAFKNWRLKQNIPLKQLAADLGLSAATISMWELGKRFPTDRHLERLLDYTALPACRLFCVMADKCVPAECLLAVPRKPSAAR
jgi:hypothetical protein